MNNYDIETSEYLSHGIKLFVCQMMGDDERSHISEYVKIFQPYGTIVDMGCGIGETGELIKEFVPDSNTINITNSAFQINYMARQGRNFVYSDYHNTGLDDGIADCVMFNESFGYGNPEKLMKEASRILKENGYVLFKDFALKEKINETLEIYQWDYVVSPLSKIISSAESAGLKLVFAFNNNYSFERCEKFFHESKMQEWHGKLYFPCNSICMKFVKMPVVAEGKSQ